MDKKKVLGNGDKKGELMWIFHTYFPDNHLHFFYLKLQFIRKKKRKEKVFGIRMPQEKLGIFEECTQLC